MKQYMLSVCYPADATAPQPAELDAIMKRVAALNREMQEARAWVFAGGLQAPETATVVRAQDGGVLMTDGPFIETKEQIGGICIVMAADLDEALSWGEKLSRATGTAIEVRPIK